MSSNLGTVTYGSLSILSGYDIQSSGPGNLIVSGTSLFAGATSIQNALSVAGGTILGSNLQVQGASTFNAASTFNNVATFAAGIVLSSVTDATNSNTGSLQVKGGLGVSLSSYLGGTLDVTGAATLRSTLSVTGATTHTGVVTISDTTESSVYTNGALVVAGGVGVAGNLRVGSGSLYLSGHLILKTDRGTGITYLNAPANALEINNAGVYNVLVNQNSSANFNVSGAVQINSTGLSVLANADSASPSAGALTVAGGAGIAMNLSVGGNITAPIGSTLTTGSAIISATTPSTNISSGSLQVLGGAGIAKSVFIGGSLDVASGTGVASWLGNVRVHSAQDGYNFIKSGDPARTAGNWTPLKFAPLTSTTSIFTINAANVTVDATTASTSPTTGSLIVKGGSGITGDLFVGGRANFAGSVDLRADTWLNNANLYLGNTSDMTSGLVYSNTLSAGGPFLFGSLGGALGTTSNTTKVALTWDVNGAVQIKGTADSTNATTGSITTVGGIGVAKSVFVGGNILLQGSSFTSGGLDLYLNAAGSNVNIRNTAGSVSGEFESTLTDFNFKTVNVTNPNPIAPFTALNIRKGTGFVRILTTDDATANQTGALQIHGGGSVTKNWWVGGNQSIAGNLTVAGTISTTGANPVVFSNTTPSTSTTTGSVVISGGLGVAENINVGGTGTFLGTASSTNPSTGTIIVVGGVGIGENLNVASDANIGGNLRVAGNISSTAGTVLFSNTTPSTAPTNGSVVIGGGIGISGGLFLAGVQNITNATPATSITTGALVVAGGIGTSGPSFWGGVQTITNATASSNATNGSLTTAGGVGIGQNLNVAGNTAISGALSIVGNLSVSSGTVNFSNTVDSTSSTSGAVTIAGGVGIAQSLFVGSPNNSTTSTSGALVITGGLGIGMDMSIGGKIALSGTNPYMRFNNSGLAAPSFTTRSIGTKIIYFSSLSDTAADFATGMDSNALWHSVPTNTATHSFRWYGGPTMTMQLDGRGTLTLNGTDDSVSSTTGTLIVNGGTGIKNSCYVGGSLNIGGTTFLNGAVTANTNVTAAGILSVTNATNSSTATNGAIVAVGGLGIGLSANIGQNLTVGGNTNVTGNVAVTGTTLFSNNGESSAISNGAVVVVGGVGIGRSLNVGGALTVGGNTTINGNLFVNGTRTQVNTQILSTTDNVILTNAAPAGSASAGFAMKRWQMANDFLDGDIVNGDFPEKVGTVQAGSTVTTIVLDNDASSVDGWYNGAWIAINAGTGTGQVRRINTYSGSTRTATIYSSADQASLGATPIEGLDWTTIPDTTSTYRIYTSQYIVSIFDEPNKEFAFGSTAVNPASDPSVPVRNHIAVHAGSMRLKRFLAVDTIRNYTTGSGTTVEGVNFKAGAVTGLASVNGSVVDVTGTVTLIDNDMTGTAILPGSKTFGSYMVLVSDINNTGASATFMISGSTSRGGSVMRTTTTGGANGEHLTISWLMGDYPRLRYMNYATNGTGATYTYKVKLIAVV